MQNDLKGRKFVVLPNLMHNEKVKFDVVATFFSSRKLNSFCTQALIKSRRIVMIACGCIAGILGLQSTGVRISFFSFVFFFSTRTHAKRNSRPQGLFFFFATQMIISIMQIFQMKFNIKEFLIVDVPNFFFRSAISEALTFVLFWALFYALVWIY